MLAGVLLAFAVDAWWDYRSDRNREEAYIEAVRSEFTSARDTLTAHVKTLSSHLDETAHFLATVVLPAAGSVSDSAIHTMVWDIGPYSMFIPARAAFDDLVSSGGLQLIQSDTLRRLLAAYGQALASDLSTQEEVISHWRNELLPYYNLHANLGRMLPGGKIGEVVMPQLTYGLDRGAFVGNRHFANLLIGRAEYRHMVIDDHNVLIQRIDAVLRWLDRAAPLSRE